MQNPKKAAIAQIANNLKGEERLKSERETAIIDEVLAMPAVACNSSYVSPTSTGSMIRLSFMEQSPNGRPNPRAAVVMETVNAFMLFQSLQKIFPNPDQIAKQLEKANGAAEDSSNTLAG